ncbi:MAG: sugar phosphate isomerase/epimerase [Phycisphaerae bacterium]|nr:sugar phosphate isomerase/epimerase [Phycisphaerae bacterium]
MSKLGIIHYNLPKEWSLSDFFDYCGRTGFEYVELQIGDVWDESDPNADPCRGAEKVRAMMDSLGLKVSALASGNDFVLLDETRIQAQVERMRRICRAAPILGTRIIRTEGGQPKDQVPPSRHVEAMAGCLKRCLEFVEPDGIRLAVDNHGLVTNDADLQLELFDRVASKHVGANLDTMNYRWAGNDLARIDRFYEIIAPHTFHVHLKDGAGSRQDYVGAVLGEGEINLEHAVACLLKAGYDGVYCAEYEGKLPTPEGYRKYLEWMKAHLG